MRIPKRTNLNHLKTTPDLIDHSSESASLRAGLAPGPRHEVDIPGHSGRRMQRAPRSSAGPQDGSGVVYLLPSLLRQFGVSARTNRRHPLK
eukprot:747091-Hanusia_phi.AAC.4